MTDKTYTVVGTSIRKGEKKLRLANGTAAAREKILAADGQQEIRLFDIPPMTAEAATAWLEAQGDAVPVRAPKEVKEKVAKAPKAEKTATIKVKNKGPADPRQDMSLDERTRTVEFSCKDEAKAKELHRDCPVMGWMDWNDLTIATRNEYRVKADEFVVAGGTLTAPVIAESQTQQAVAA